MKLLRRAKVGNVLKNHAAHKPKRQKKVSESQLKFFLEVEKTTFDGTKHVALISFAAITGALALLLKLSETDIPGRSIFISILGCGLFAALFLLYLFMSNYRKSLAHLVDNPQIFIKLRIVALARLQAVVYAAILSFLLCIISFILKLL